MYSFDLHHGLVVGEKQRTLKTTWQQLSHTWRWGWLLNVVATAWLLPLGLRSFVADVNSCTLKIVATISAHLIQTHLI